MKCLVTGGAGFIGSNLAEKLLNSGNEVVVLDDLSTGKRANIEAFLADKRFRFIEGTVTDPETCRLACSGTEYVFHEAAVCSVPESIKHPKETLDINVTGTANVFLAARDAHVRRVVWASSTSVYGNSKILPNVESMPLNTLSPYAASKAAGEMFARAFSEVFDISIISLRYYNVFGKRQDPLSAYAAVIPLFVSKLLAGERPVIYGDGNQTRDFIYIDNVVDANMLAAFNAPSDATGKSYNIGSGSRITINELYGILAGELGLRIEPLYGRQRGGEVRDSVADISAARRDFEYNPSISVREGLKMSLDWYKENFNAQ
jgi:UDP-N-acetylglucosamine/UDP-N-acetylgalactosamine 4-epimerase